MSADTLLQQKRLNFKPPIPALLNNLNALQVSEINSPHENKNDKIKKFFPNTYQNRLLEIQEGKSKNSTPKKVGVVFSGGQASGGHNVIAGLFYALQALNSNNELFGFLNGPLGIIENKHILLTKEVIDPYRNIGGFHLIGSGRTKIESQQQLECSLKTMQSLKLDGLVIIGGDDSNTNAAILAEFFKSYNQATSVIGVPKTIDGDLKNSSIEISFGFDTACKVYSEIIGNILLDALSAKKYYHFIKLMGRSASHIALECAFQTHPNLTLIGEEVQEKKMTLKQITDLICDLICKRAASGKNYGVILIPEGLIEFIVECKQLISELNKLLLHHQESIDQCSSIEDKLTLLGQKLSTPSKTCFNSLPNEIAEQLLLDRDSHGNVQVARISTEQLLMKLVDQELTSRFSSGSYKGQFNALSHYLGYEGRAAYPSNFDAKYCYTLGRTAMVLIQAEVSGYMATVQNLTLSVDQWKPCGIPICSLIHLEERSGSLKPVIKKAFVDLQGAPFKKLESMKASWADNDDYRSPGPIQFFGETDLTEDSNFTLKYEQSS